jgi:hypothetical protein
MQKNYLDATISVAKVHKIFEPNACLLVVEQNNEILMKHYESLPMRSVALPEENATNIGSY